MELSAQLPEWLSDGGTYTPRHTQLEETYENLFVKVLDQVTMGRPVSHIIREDPRNIEVAAYLRWIHKDPERQTKYYDARVIGADLVEDELIHIADAEDNPLEDVQRSTLRINTRKWLLEVWNRKRYSKPDSNVNVVTNVNQVTLPTSESLMAYVQQKLGATYEHDTSETEQLQEPRVLPERLAGYTGYDGQL